jgi:hypothetical protein
MKKPVLAMLGAVLMSAPAAAAGDQVSIRLVAVVPVQCTLDVLGYSLSERELLVNVRRHCNTSHEVLLQGNAVEGLGDVDLRFNGASRPFGGGYASLYQPELYYDQTDTISIAASDGDIADLLQFASTLQISVVPA